MSEDQSSERPLAELAREITSGAVRLSAAMAAWLMLVAEFDERQGWGGPGIKSCAHWLSWQCGLSIGAAREHVRVARALRRLPRTAAAFLDGRISYAKARALTRVAEPATEATLLDFAVTVTASQTERALREIRRADRVEEVTVAERRQFDHWWDDDGMLVLRARLSAEEGADLLTAVQARAEREARRERAEATRVAAGHDLAQVDRDIARRYDEPDGRLAAQQSTARRCAALAALARDAAHVGRRAGDPPRREVVVHVDAGVLADDAAAGDAYIEGGPALSGADVRRMLCEATVLTMLEKSREPLSVGRRHRRATRAQRRALLRRDGGCARPGCPEIRPERLHAHHIRHWLFGGPTDLDNLVLLCDSDHGLVHELDLVMHRRDGELVVLDAEGRRVWGRADAAFDSGLDGVASGPEDDGSFVGVQPIDERVERRPTDVDAVSRRSCAVPATPQRRSRRRLGSSRRTTALGAGFGDIAAMVFPDGEPPDLPDTLEAGGERMSLTWVVGVLMDNRDAARRLAVEAGTAA
jgi:Domain of unknown function (DUF222)/HNH endonuclease